MVTVETLAIINIDLESESQQTENEVHGDDSRPERSQLPPHVTMKLKLKRQQTESEVHLPGQVQEKLSAKSTKNALFTNNRKAMQPSNNYSNNRSKNAEAKERKLIYEKCMNFFRFLASLLGIRMTYDWKPQRYFVFLFMCFVQFFAYFSIFYTVYVHYVNGSFIRILEPLAISGITVSCALKLYAYSVNWHRILSLMYAIRKYFRPNVFGRRAEMIKSSLRKTWTFLILYTVGIFVCSTIYAFSPIMVYLSTNEVIPLLPIEIVFCDQSQISGFVVAAIAHLMMGFFGTLLTLFNGAVIIFCVRNYILQGDLIVEDFKEVDGMWNGINNTSVDYKHAFLKNICIKRQDMNNYLIVVKYVFETQFFIYYCCSFFSQIICLYNITQNDWIGGFGTLIGLSLEMMFYCYMGTQISIVDDKLCYSFYNSNWYMYDLESQRMVGMLLHECQQSKDLQLGTIGPLNLMAGVMIVKSIYSYYTVMKELF